MSATSASTDKTDKPKYVTWEDEECDLKIGLLGGGGIGAKSSLVFYLLHGHRVEMYDPTIEDSYHYTFTIDGERISSIIVDTAGQEEYASVRDGCIKHFNIAIVGYAITSRGSFDEVSQFMESIRQNGKKNVVLYGVGNKCDLENQRQVSKKEAQYYFSHLSPPVPFLETSCVTGENVRKVFEEAVRLWMQQRNNNHGDEAEQDLIITMIGGTDSGSKTSMISYLKTKHLPTKYIPTDEDFYYWRTIQDGHEIVAKIIDTGGAPEQKDVRDKWIKRSDVIVLGFSFTSRESFEQLRSLHDHILEVGKKGVVIIGVGNKIDLVDQQEVDRKEAASFFRSLDPSIPFFETSCKTGENVLDVFNEAISLWCKSMKQSHGKCLIM